MNALSAKIEAILFLSSRPVSIKKMAKITQSSEEEIRQAVEVLKEKRNVVFSGMHVFENDQAVELGSNPEFSDILQTVTKEESESDLTPPQLETLTIIAYRGPVTKAEIEHIRGVNCTIILRNLLMRGLIIEQKNVEKIQPEYIVSTELLRHLGVAAVQELPDYERLHNHEKVDQLLEEI